ncbi:unnamed protein product [Spirodela intermedia]|uniref:Uncharacterized protein n=1 Tax=Spirodela intermedia TaxID=51605 RepID=A0A7I8J559_SPIIN|nr:unnamed protein product [Spirodela intermedia]CAA6665199.1 unnamed protein product [Spirodela intermedia]
MGPSESVDADLNGRAPRPSSLQFEGRWRPRCWRSCSWRSLPCSSPAPLSRSPFDHPECSEERLGNCPVYCPRYCLKIGFKSSACNRQPGPTAAAPAAGSPRRPGVDGVES